MARRYSQDDRALIFLFFSGVQNGKSQKFTPNENAETCLSCVKQHISGHFSQMTLQKRFPIAKWLPNYSLGYLVRDFIAGITVGLTAIPQGIAYANVAGLEPQVST